MGYSVYIWQFTITATLAARLQSSDWTASGTFNLLLKSGIIVGATTVAAYCSYRMIEMPSRRWLRKVLSGKAWATKMRAKN
jgi:peptidoglycan/LPS O-acetylase OafA/YrhL